MSKYGHNLLRFGLLDQRVINHNMLLPRRAIEVRITVRTLLTPIDHVQFMQRKFQPVSLISHSTLNGPSFNGLSLLNNGQYEDGVDRNPEDLHRQHEHEHICKEQLPSHLNDLQERCEQWSTKADHQGLALQYVRHSQFDSLLVKPEFFLQHEGPVVAERQAEKLTDQCEYEEQYRM